MVTNKVTELKPCPFCGGEAKYIELYRDKSGVSSGYIRCMKPIPCVAQSNVRSESYCCKKWNRRAGDGK